MDTMILAIHVFVCISLVVLVLLQSGKEGMGVIFGGGSSSLFGSSGAGGVLAKMTAFMAVIFVVTSLGYNIATTERAPSTSVVNQLNIEDVPPASPAAPAPAAQQAPAQAAEGGNATAPAN